MLTRLSGSVYHDRSLWFQRAGFSEETVSLPITAWQLNALRAPQQSHPDLGEITMAVSLAVDASQI
jgi:hypothetical protein